MSSFEHKLCFLKCFSMPWIDTGRSHDPRHTLTNLEVIRLVLFEGIIAVATNFTEHDFLRVSGFPIKLNKDVSVCTSQSDISCLHADFIKHRAITLKGQGHIVSTKSLVWMNWQSIHSIKLTLPSVLVSSELINFIGLKILWKSRQLCDCDGQ